MAGDTKLILSTPCPYWATVFLDPDEKSMHHLNDFHQITKPSPKDHPNEDIDIFNLSEGASGAPPDDAGLTETILYPIPPHNNINRTSFTRNHAHGQDIAMSHHDPTHQASGMANEFLVEWISV